jgi:hypothetical protein
MRLSEIPDEKLEAIRRWLGSSEAQYLPIMSASGPSLQTRVKEKFGADLSPAQISLLKKGYRKYSVQLPEDVVLAAEKNYGSLSDAFKHFTAAVKAEEKIPPDVKPVVEKLGGKTLTYEEAIRTLQDMGYEPGSTLTKLKRAGFFFRRGDQMVFTKTPVDPVAQFLGSMIYGGGGGNKK